MMSSVQCLNFKNNMLILFFFRLTLTGHFFNGQFPHLTFLDSAREALQVEPFNSTIADRIMELLAILNSLQTCFDDEGNTTAEGHQIMDLYFRRQTAIFSDESPELA